MIALKIQLAEEKERKHIPFLILYIYFDNYIPYNGNFCGILRHL